VIHIKGSNTFTQKDYTLTINKELLAKMQPSYLPSVEDFFDILHSNLDNKPETDLITPEFGVSI
jgi:hypothetical protein